MTDVSLQASKSDNSRGTRTLSILVENRFGVLSRIAGLFSARGYNIESLTVAGSSDPGSFKNHDGGTLRIAPCPADIETGRQASRYG